MNILRIATENPEIEQWRLLSQFAYPSNIRKHLLNRGLADIEDETVEFVAGSIRQGEAFFQAAKNAPLDILPLLLYYGSANLMIGAHGLIINQRPRINNHGMSIVTDETRPATRIADVMVLPRNPNDGALQQFCNIFSKGCTLADGGTWTLGEILGSIPDLKHDFESFYQDMPYYTVPVEVVRTRRRNLERIANRELNRYQDLAHALSFISGLSQAYLTPQHKPNYVILFPKIDGQEIGTYSVSGRKYLQIDHAKNGKLRSPDQVILMFMGVYILGFLPRYRPELWNPFTRSDTTGEKLIIEKFLFICQRYLPNLVLNYIYGQRVQFVNETEGILDLTATLTENELNEIVREAIQDLRSKGEVQ